MIFDAIKEFALETGIANLDYKSAIMLGVSLLFLYLAINRGFEPLLLVPIAFGMLLSNLPITGIFSDGGLLYTFYSLKSVLP
ncbi:MAG TPA: sodium ion-translocating decarboxylase subunit beta, partial [Anaerovoracaceae bacterium]|nr:sodium ion-translocating decarboxylase subunit beta [Anaerovoracaceae bacterium]